MKKTQIFLNICIILICAFIIYLLITHLIDIFDLSSHINELEQHYNYLITHPEITNQETINITFINLNEEKDMLKDYIIQLIISFIALVCILIVFFLSNSQCFSNKQKRIAQLQAELDELKKDD